MVARRTSKNHHCMVADGETRSKMPLGMEWQISNENSRPSPTQTWIALGKTGGYLQLRSFTFLHCTISTYDLQFMVVAVSCPKVFFRKWCWCRDLASKGSDNKGSLANPNFLAACKTSKNRHCMVADVALGAFLSSHFAVQIWTQNGPKNQHSLEEQFWHLATAAS